MRRLPAAPAAAGHGARAGDRRTVRAGSVAGGSVAGGAATAGNAGRRPDRLRAAIFGGLIVAILAGAAWALLGSSLFVVRHIEVVGNGPVPAAQVRAAARIRAGQPLARVNTAAAAHRVEQIPAVLSATVSRSWPETIVITVRDRTPRLAVAAGRGYDLVDEYGVTVSVASRKPAGLPLLTAPPAVLLRNPGVHAAALVVSELPPALRSRLRSVSVTPAAAVVLHLSGGVTVLWGGPGQAAQKWAELGLLLPTHARFYDVSDPATAVTQP